MALLIVVSGVLVAVALVFLIIGLFQHSGIGFILVSIVTSLVSGVFLLLGALQRRGAPAAVADGGSTGAEALERVTAVSVRPREDAPAEAPAAEVAMVSVVRGRPRYHVESCRFLTGRPDVEQVSVDEARGEGYTACGVCKPDAALEAAATAAEPAAEAEADETQVLDTTSATDEATPARTARGTAAKKAPARTAASRSTASRAAATATADAAESAPAKPAKKAAATKATAAKSTAAAAKPAAGQVVVIPDRGKFHTESCRFVKDVPGTVTLTKTTAKRQGYTACGVCKP